MSNILGTGDQPADSGDHSPMLPTCSAVLTRVVCAGPLGAVRPLDRPAWLYADPAERAGHVGLKQHKLQCASNQSECSSHAAAVADSAAALVRSMRTSD